MGETFECEVCKGTFPRRRSEADLDAELARNWPDGVADDDKGYICGPCYQIYRQEKFEASGIWLE